MSPRLSALLLAAVLCLPGHGRAEDRRACETAIAAEEARGALPPGLLGAIARVESGRWDPQAQRRAPWPWALNAAGSGELAPSREAALQRLREHLARGTRSVDVGCMQVNLRHHPDAFSSLEDAFDPPTNVAYAARFLLDLHRRHGGWPAAIARYHSGTPERGDEYLRRVTLAWGEAPHGPAPLPARARDPVVVMLAPVASQVQVFRPSPPTAVPRPVSVTLPSARRG
jgi:hypothetical protein